MSVQDHQPYIVTQKNKTMNFRQYLSLYISQKNIFAAARMRFIFVTRCAGNKIIFSFGLTPHLSFSTWCLTWYPQACVCLLSYNPPRHPSHRSHCLNRTSNCQQHISLPHTRSCHAYKGRDNIDLLHLHILDNFHSSRTDTSIYDPPCYKNGC